MLAVSLWDNGGEPPQRLLEAMAHGGNPQDRLAPLFALRRAFAIALLEGELW